MLGVECESCKAPYQIDERRIPPAGLKMRCPKCGHSFLVMNPANAAAAGPASVKGPPLTKPIMKPPMTGMGAASAPAAPQGPTLRGLVPKKETLRGVAASVFPPLPAPLDPPPPESPVEPTATNERPSDFPAALGSLDEVDLPVISAALPAIKDSQMPPADDAAADLRAAQVRAPGGGREFGELDFDLPAIPGAGEDLPAARSPGPEFGGGRSPSFDLPVAKAPPARSPSFDLPVAKAPPPARSPSFDLPAAKAPPARAPSVDLPSAGSSDFDLPVARGPVAGGPPSAGPRSLVDLPAVPRAGSVTGLPAVASNLPAPAQVLPDLAAGLPSPVATPGGPPRPGGTQRTAPLPPQRTVPIAPKRTVPLGGGGGSGAPPPPLPVSRPAAPPPVSRAFGEVRLPSAPPASISQPEIGGISTLSGFGEIDLPREQPSGTHGVTIIEAPPPRLPSVRPPGGGGSGTQQLDPAADFGDLQFGDDEPPPASPPFDDEAPPAALSGGGAAAPSGGGGAGAPGEGGGLTFGEVDFGSGTPSGPAGGDAIKLDSFQWSPPTEGAVSNPDMAAVVPEDGGEPGEHALPETSDVPAAPSRLGLILKIVAALVVLGVVIGGASLELTPYGAWGRVYFSDMLHAADYEAASSGAVRVGEATLKADTYDAARTAVDTAAQSHARMPRARPLTAYAALIDAASQLRFGQDPARASRAKQLFAELPTDKPVQYFDAAAAAIAASDGDSARALKLLDAASQQDQNGAIQIEVALLRGGVQLASKDAASAVASYKRAAQLAPPADARPHFGLARAYDLLGDGAGAKKEIDLTLAASKEHSGALILRARRRTAHVDPVSAFADLAIVLDGPGRAKASPMDLSDAYAAKAWVSLERGAASDARGAFGQAVKLNPRNVEALSGEGRLLLNEGRPAEALAHFDSALQADPNSPEAIANDAEAKMGLERLADAKQQLVQARERFPRSIPVLLLLGRVEEHLGNQEEADKDMRAAIAHVDPLRRDAVMPYVALAELLLRRGRAVEATALLDEAKKKLPGSVTLERGLGEVAEMEGSFDAAVANYKAALALDPKDVAAHFHLGLALIRTLKFDEASAELDKVAAIDKDYPGLSLERGILFEKSGDVMKAIEQFEGALAKAPDDPDLLLRVGSAYVIISMPDKAIPMLRRVVDKRPSSAEAHHYFGRALMLKGGASWADALIHLGRAVELDPNRVEYHVYRAWAANDSTPAQIKVAQEEVEKAFALDRSNPEAYWQRGIVRRMTSQIEDAIKDEQHALKLRPSRYEAHATLAECYEEKNQPGDALAEWAMALAGDGKRTNADGTVLHPFWHFQYGKLLLEHQGPGAAIGHLLPAALAAEQMDSRPGWGIQLEFLVAEVLRTAGRTKEALDHYHRFVELAGPRDPDFKAADRAIKALDPDRP